MGKKDSQEKNIQVVLRCRPRSNQEIKDGSPSIIDCLGNKKEVAVKHSIAENTLMTKTFGFDRVFDPNSTQLDIYKYVVCPVLEEVLLGYNCTIFAYGQTGTGKTFTMEGEKSLEGGSWDKEPQAGIIPRAMQQLFEILEALPDREFSVRVSFLEIYNEDLFDLLGSSLDSQKLRLFEDSTKKGSVVVQGLEETIVHDKDEVYEILEKGRTKRQTAATLMNAHSSRSHSLFSVTVHTKESSVTGEEMLKTGKLNLVDLAGSENVGRSGAVDKRLREAGTINQSLLTLGRVITALVERAPHVPYRESKLTRLLQDSLGGRTKTCIIATISPAACNVEETLSTLDYAHRAKNILNRPEINQKLTKKALIKEYTEEIDKLKKDLLAAREKNGIFLAVENYNDMQNKIKSQSETLSEIRDKLSHLEKELAKTLALFNDTSEELLGTKEKLQETRMKLQQITEDRDGLDFVAQKYDQTAANLFARSTELLGAVKNMESDNERLHNTLERKQLLEAKNAHQKEAYKTHFSTSLKSLKEDVVNYCEDDKAKSSEYLKWLDDDISKKSEMVSRQSSFYDEMFARRQVLINKIFEHEKTHVESCTQDWKENLAQLVTTKRDEIVEFLLLMTSDKWNEAIQCSRETFDECQKTFEDINAFATQQHAEREEKNAQFLEQIRALTDAVEKKLENHSSQQTQLTQQRLVNKRNTNSVFEKRSLEMKNILERMSSLIEQQNETYENDWQEEVETISKIDSDVSTVTQDCKSLFQSRSEEDIKFVSNMSLHDKKTLTGIIDRVQRTAPGLDRSIALFPYIEETAQFASKNGIRMAEEWHQLLENAHENDIAKMTENLAFHQQHAQVCRTECKSEHDTLLEYLRSDEKNHLDLVTFCRESTRSRLEELDELQHRHSCTTNGIDGGMAKFINVDLLEDVPSGMTPTRQQYRYPTQLSKTQPRSELLRVFKESYIIPTTPQLDRTFNGEPVEDEDSPLKEDEVFVDKSTETSSLSCSDEENVPVKENIESVKTSVNRKKAKSAEAVASNQCSPLMLRSNYSTYSGSSIIERSRLSRSKNTSKSQ